MPSGSKNPLDRRDVLRGLGTAGVAGLAGCNLGNQPTDTPSGEDTPESVSTPTPEPLGDTLVGPDGNQVTLQAVFSQGQTTQTTMEFVAQEYANMGINLELTSVQFPTMLSQYARTTYTPEGADEPVTTFNAGPRDEATSQEPWDIMGGIGFNGYWRTPTSISTFWIDERKGSQAGVNFYGYRPSANLEELFNQASTETDDARRQELLANIFGVLSEDQPTNYVTFDVNLNGFRQGVTNLNPGPAFGWDSPRWAFSDGTEPAGGGFVTGSESDAQNLNFLRTADTSSANRIGLTLDGAYGLDNDDNVVPLWVESIEDEDKRIWRYTLRDGLQWGAGFGQMTAEDWVYFINEVHQAEENWAGDANQDTWFRSDPETGESVPIEARETGDLTFELELPQVDPAFLKKPVMWGAWCMPKGLVEQYRPDNDGEGFNQDPVVQELQYASGNLGPYTFERWDRDSVFEATRNSDYYLAESDVFSSDVPNFPSRSYQVFGETSTRLSALETGEVHNTGISPSRVQEFQDNPDTKVVQTPSSFCNMIVYNQRANGWEQLRKSDVRMALSMGVDKKVIVEDINRGFANVAHTHQPDYSQWYDESQVVKTGYEDSYRPQEAKHMLIDALPNGYNYE